MNPAMHMWNNNFQHKHIRQTLKEAYWRRGWSRHRLHNVPSTVVLLNVITDKVVIGFLWGFHVAVEHDEAMMCCIVTALVTLPGALLSIQVSANVGLYGSIGARTLERPSVCFTHLRDALEKPLQNQRKRENEVCYRREKKKTSPLCE